MTQPDSRKIRMLLALRKAGITDTRVLSAFEKVPREAFVPKPFSDQAYEDKALPIGYQQTISRPSTVAQMTQALELTDRTKVLEIGTGSGYQAAILSRVARRVYTIERHRDLLTEAEARFQALNLHNITTKFGDGAKGWPEQAPFARILLTAVADDLPEILINQLDIGGLMVLPLATPDGQKIVRLRKTEAGIETEIMGATHFVPFVQGLPED